jgi:hypothetical protein
MQGLPWLLVRLLHVLTGAVWAGAAILIALHLMPAVRGSALTFRLQTAWARWLPQSGSDSGSSIANEMPAQLFSDQGQEG